MTMPRISVIMPVYNAEKYLRESVRSVLGQTLGDVELIAVDDGSTDASGGILDELAAADGRLRVIHKTNGGPAAARNAALDVARGDYLMFCDSDDAYLPDCCQRMLSAIEANPVDLVMCRNEFVFEDNVDADYYRRRIGEGEGIFDSGRPGVVPAKSEMRFFGTNVLLWNKIFRHDVVRRFGIRFPDGHEHDDDAFCYQYAMVSGDALRIPDRLYLYRLRAGSITDSYVTRKPRNRYDRLAVADFLVGFARRHGVDGVHARFLVRLWREFYLMVVPYFSEDELASLRLELVEKARPYFTSDSRLVDSRGTLLWINRKGSLKDLLEFCWHRIRSLTAAGDTERRNRILVKAERSWLTWKTR